MKSDKPKNFESALQELEKIVTSMESGQMPLEQSLACYKRGAELLKYCQNSLEDARSQIKVLEADMLRNFSLDSDHAKD